VAHADDRERAEGCQHHHGDEVLREAQHGPTADQRDVEVVVEQRAVRLEVDRGEDDEAPEGERVRGAGDRPLEQLALPEHLFDLREQACAQPVEPVDRLTGLDELEQELRAAGREAEHHEGDQQTEDQSNDHELSRIRRQ
jgi:hypothetical protein